MSMSEGTATLGERGGRHTLGFERFLSHSRERVWQAIAEEDELSSWFPARMVGGRAVGATLRFIFPRKPGQVPADSIEDGVVMAGEMLVFDPPSVLAYRWDVDVLRWELEDHPDGTLFTFSHTFDDKGRGARDAAGWDICFASLKARLAERPVEPFTHVRHQNLFAHYARRFGPVGSVHRSPTM